MSVDRLERVNSLLKRVIGEAVFRVLQGDDVNPGVVTVTEVKCAKNLRNATVKVSVFRRTHEFERIVNAEVRLKFTPQLRFVIDHSLEKGDHVLALLDNLPPPAEG